MTTTGFRAILFMSAWCMFRLIVSPAAPVQGKESVGGLQRLKYNHPGLVVDLGVGLWAWPLPMDYDNDGDLDLVVNCPDKPYNGTYFFENTDGKNSMPVFRPGVRIAAGLRNVQISYVDGEPYVFTPGTRYADFREHQFGRPTKLDVPPFKGRLRANQWKTVDYDGDGRLDLIVGIGDWSDYGWDDAFDQRGQWTNGPLHGYVYMLRNTGAKDRPRYAKAIRVEAAGRPVDVFGMPSPNFADFDGDDDLDLLCGEFIDGFTYFENTGTRREPVYAAGKRLPIHMDLCMITPVAVDWDADGDIDLIVGDEDGRVAFIEHTGRVRKGVPEFLPPRYFQQQADDVKFGALATPVGFDWDGDGDDDLLCGNTAGYIGFIENLDGGNPPRWAAPRYLEVEGKPIRVMAGPNGSIQGPCEKKWGYTTLTVADWNHDDLPDLIVNTIWGKVVVFRNIGSRESPKLTGPEPIRVAWPKAPPKPAWNWWDPVDNELATQWRTTPLVTDLNADGLNDLVMLDHEGYLAFFPRSRNAGQLTLLPGRRVFRIDGPSTFNSQHAPQESSAGPLRLNNGTAGRSGRRKLCLADWDGDGKIDLLVNSGINVNWLRQVERKGQLIHLEDAGPLDQRRIGAHTTSPAVVDWNQDGKPELLVGAEDGYLYYKPTKANPSKDED